MPNAKYPLSVRKNVRKILGVRALSLLMPKRCVSV